MKAVAKILFAGSLVIVLSMVLGISSGFAQEMTMKEYKAQLQEWADREMAAKTEIAKCDNEIASLNSQIADLDGQIAGVWGDIYSALGVSESDVNAYRSQLDDMDRELSALSALSPEDLFKRRKEIDAMEEKLGGMKSSPIYNLTEMRDRIAGLEGKIATLRDKMPKGMYDEYTVNRGDYLWKISRNQYGEGIQWYRIYSYNRNQIGADPDLIYPDRVLKIHQENAPGVGNGDNLAKIAGSMDVMSDPTKWRQLYEANKDVIGDDSSLIYPHTVLKIPGR